MTCSELKVKISQLSNEDLYKLVNDEIVDYRKEEITLAYDEMERRGTLPKSTDQVPRPVVSPLGCLIGSALFIVEVFIVGDLLPSPRAAAVAVFVSLVSSYWHKSKHDLSTFWKYLLWSAGIVLLGSLAFGDIPNLLRQRIPVALAFGIPAAVYLIALYWFYESYWPSRQERSAADE